MRGTGLWHVRPIPNASRLENNRGTLLILSTKSKKRRVSQQNQQRPTSLLKDKPKGLPISLYLSLVAWLVVGVTGCAWTDKNGTHHLIVGLGFGIVTTKNDLGVDVMDSRILGAEVGSFGVGFGWMQHHRVTIDPALTSNVVVSVNSNPLGLTVRNFNPYSTAVKQKSESISERKIKNDGKHPQVNTKSNLAAGN